MSDNFGSSDIIYGFMENTGSLGEKLEKGKDSKITNSKVTMLEPLNS